MKKFLAAAILGTMIIFAAGSGTASAALYRRPIVHRPYYAGYWHRPVYAYAPTVYTYPTYPAYTYPSYTYPTCAPYYNPGVYVGVPSIGVRIGR